MKDLDIPISRGLEFLKNECKGGRFPTYWGSGPEMKRCNEKNWNDNFVPILAANCLSSCQWQFESICSPILMRIFSFLLGKFRKSPVIGFFHSQAARKKWPADGDDTGFAASVLLQAGADRELFQETVKVFWDNYDEKRGDFKMYFGGTPQFRKKERSDPMATISMIIFLFLMGEDIKKLSRPIGKIFHFFKEKAYLQEGFSFYYHNPIVFLYYVGMMIETLQLPINKKLFVERVCEVVELDEENPLNLAMGMTSIARFGEANIFWLALLCASQSLKDGGWPVVSIFRLGRTETESEAARTFRYSGSRAATTALAVQALCKAKELV